MPNATVNTNTAQPGSIFVYNDPNVTILSNHMRAHLIPSNESALRKFIKNLEKALNPNQIEQNVADEKATYLDSVKNMREYIAAADANPDLYDRSKGSSYALFLKIAKCAELAQEGKPIDFRKMFKDSGQIEFPQLTMVATKRLENVANGFFEKLKEVNIDTVEGMTKNNKNRLPLLPLHSKYPHPDNLNIDQFPIIYGEIATHYYNSHILEIIKQDTTISKEDKKKNEQFNEIKNNSANLFNLDSITKEGLGNLLTDNISKIIDERDNVLTGVAKYNEKVMQAENKYFSKMLDDLKQFVEEKNASKIRKKEGENHKPIEYRKSTTVESVGKALHDGISGLEKNFFTQKSVYSAVTNNSSDKSVKSPPISLNSDDYFNTVPIEVTESRKDSVGQVSVKQIEENPFSPPLSRQNSDELKFDNIILPVTDASDELSEINSIKGIYNLSNTIYLQIKAIKAIPNVLEVEIKDDNYVIQFLDGKIESYPVKDFEQIFTEQDGQLKDLHNENHSKVNTLDNIKIVNSEKECDPYKESDRVRLNNDPISLKAVRFQEMATIIEENPEEEKMEPINFGHDKVNNFKPMEQYFTPTVLQKLKKARLKDKNRSFLKKLSIDFDYQIYDATIRLLKEIVPEDKEIIDRKWIEHALGFKRKKYVSWEDLKMEEVRFKNGYINKRKVKFIKCIIDNEITKHPYKLSRISSFYTNSYLELLSDNERIIKARMENKIIEQNEARKFAKMLIESGVEGENLEEYINNFNNLDANMTKRRMSASSSLSSMANSLSDVIPQSMAEIPVSSGPRFDAFGPSGFQEPEKPYKSLDFGNNNVSQTNDTLQSQPTKLNHSIQDKKTINNPDSHSIPSMSSASSCSSFINLVNSAPTPPSTCLPYSLSQLRSALNSTYPETGKNSSKVLTEPHIANW